MTPGSTLHHHSANQQHDLAELFEFLDRQLASDLALATEREEVAEARYLTQSRAIVDAIRLDLTSDPRPADEVVRFLGRTVAAYRGRPGFRSSWLLLA